MTTEPTSYQQYLTQGQLKTLARKTPLAMVMVKLDRGRMHCAAHVAQDFIDALTAQGWLLCDLAVLS